MFQFKRAAGPKNRRNPTRSVRRPRADVSEDAPAMKNGSVEVIDLQATNPASHEAEREQATNGVCHVSANTTPGFKPRIGFLNIHGNNSCTDPQLPNKSPDHSPASSTSNKPFVPPLDLSILHEHIEGGGKIGIFISRPFVERNGSGVELRILNYENPGSNPGCGVKTLGKFFHSTLFQFTQLNK